MVKIQEIWKDVVGYEGLYQVSNLGQVKTHQKILKQYGDRYSRVGLYKNKRQINCVVHRLVAIAFIPNPLRLPQVNHKNGIRSDNRAENLEWVTNRENVIHYYKGKRELPTGVYLRVTENNYSRYVVNKHINGKYVHIGCFHTIEEASLAYQNAPI